MQLKECVDAEGIPELHEGQWYYVLPLACGTVRVLLYSDVGSTLVCAGERFQNVRR